MIKNSKILEDNATIVITILTAILALSVIATSEFAAPAFAETTLPKGGQTSPNTPTTTTSSSSLSPPIPQSVISNIQDAIKAIQGSKNKDAMTILNTTGQTLDGMNSASAISTMADMKTARESLQKGNTQDAITHLNQALEHSD